MDTSTNNIENLDLVAIGSDEFAGLSVYQQSFLIGKGLNKAITSQAKLIETAALVTFGGNTEPAHDVWIKYRDGAIKGHQEDEDAKTGTVPERGPIAAKADGEKGRQWFSRHCKKPLVAYWAAQTPAREFIAPLKTPKGPAKKLTATEKAAEKVATAKKSLLDKQLAEVRATRDACTKAIAAAASLLIKAHKAEDKKTVKGASAKLEKIRKAIAAAEGVS
jgi:hypothetical protein